MDSRDMTRRQRKRATRELLVQRDVAALVDWARRDGRVMETLSVLVFERDELLRWRAIEAIGRVAAVVAATDLEKVRNLMRRLLWWMNDESGISGWHAPETIGAILVNVPSLIDDFGAIMGSFLNEEPFERGAHWAVACIATLRPDIFADRVDELEASLKVADPFIRAYAIIALKALGAESIVHDNASLAADASKVRLYDTDTGELFETTVGQLAREVPEAVAEP